MIKILIILTIICFALNIACDRLGGYLESISTEIKMDRDIAGATFLAVSSSLPEFITSFLAIVVFNKFEDVGFATVAGSGIFNALLIPAFAILVYTGKNLEFKVKMRDIKFYSITVAVLGISMTLGEFSWRTGIALMVVYCFYIKALAKDQTRKIEWKLAKRKDVIMSILYLIPIALFIHLAIENAIKLSDIVGIKTFVVSVIVLAAVTSIPDLFMSIAESRKGEIESAVSNAVGSNVFDLCVCLGLPLLITGANITTSFHENAGIFGFLVASIFLTAYVLNAGLQKWRTIKMFALYSGFIYYVVALA